MALKLKSSMAPSTWVALAAFVIFSFSVHPRAMGARLLGGLEWPCCREYEAPPTASAVDIDSVYGPYHDLAPAAPRGPIVPLNPDSFCDCPGPGPEPRPAPPPHAGGSIPALGLLRPLANTTSMAEKWRLFPRLGLLRPHSRTRSSSEWHCRLEYAACSSSHLLFFWTGSLESSWPWSRAWLATDAISNPICVPGMSSSHRAS